MAEERTYRRCESAHKLAFCGRTQFPIYRHTLHVPANQRLSALLAGRQEGLEVERKGTSIDNLAKVRGVGVCVGDRAVPNHKAFIPESGGKESVLT